MHCPWLLLCYNGRVEQLWQKLHSSLSLKYLVLEPLEEKPIPNLYHVNLWILILFHYYHYLLWFSNWPRFGHWKPLQAGSCVLLTGFHCSLNSSLLSDITGFSRPFLLLPWNKPFFQGTLAPFSQKWYLEINVWALGGHCPWDVAGRQKRGHGYSYKTGNC